jgi:hypothetical protein
MDRHSPGHARVDLDRNSNIIHRDVDPVRVPLSDGMSDG